MKTYEQRTQDVIEKKAAYDKRRRGKTRAIISGAGALCLILAIVVLLSPTLQGFVGISAPQVRIKGIERVSNYSQLYSTLSTIYKDAFLGQNRGWLMKDSVAVNEAGAVPAAPQSDAQTNKAESSVTDNGISYSDTNLQVAGVQEADIIKTDGQYIYVIANSYLHIIKATDGSLEPISKVGRTVSDDESTSSKFEMYVRVNRLIVIEYITKQSDNEMKSSKAPSDAYFYYKAMCIQVEVFDITDKSVPKSVATYGQDGRYTSSRMVGDILYLVSSHSLYTEPDKKDPATYVPSVYRNGTAELIRPEDIYVNPNCKYQTYYMYLIVSGINTANDADGIVSSQALFGYGDNIYANTKSLYIAGSDWETKKIGNKVTNRNATKIIRFSLDNGIVKFVVEASVDGEILNQFSMDEYNDVFRIVTTVYSVSYIENNTGDYSSWENARDMQTNSLYTLNAADLSVMGSITKLANSERVYSVRFDGDIGYFVTFRQVDPLFTVDLSDPANPKVLSALKIPGFSEYLHPYADGLLFGLGKDADEQSGRAGFMKLSMFDVSDPNNVSVAHTFVIPNITYSEASYNHKAILINATLRIIAFPTEATYSVYTYSAAKGFEKLKEVYLSSNGYWGDDLRGLYIDNHFYVIGTSSAVILSFDMNNDYKKTAHIFLPGELNDTNMKFD